MTKRHTPVPNMTPVRRACIAVLSATTAWNAGAARPKRWQSNHVVSSVAGEHAITAHYTGVGARFAAPTPEQYSYQATGPTATASIRLYLAPGMGHCLGGDGPNIFDLDTPLAAWVEDNKAPGSILALHFSANASPTKPDHTRPLCPNPEIAKFKGSGSTDDATNFACAKP